MKKDDILIRPLITEKISVLPEKLKAGKERYTFVVNQRANKIQIAKAVKEMYGVEVVAVNTLNYKGKPKTRYTKSKIVSGRTPSYKKAIVTLAEGEFIDFYSNI
ncbi:MAG: 50S ribosomal protein L23 [Bacteroidia bacterium]|nr:50S ribosomal protein L23 [Bacteroidia bacterium]